ncbi:MAG: methionine biosynthesis protein MetW [Coriobacteriia bacterium]|nr:methionine biosynthesis protein MetW [Coriobacteriia bacterium]
MTPGRLRSDLVLIAGLIPEGSRVLDLGCADAALLSYLRDTKGAFVRGVDVSRESLARSIERGVPVFQGDLDEGLADFRDDSFDVVVLSQTLQVVRQPMLVLKEMLRVGKKGIISIPNFGHWRNRARLGLGGRMPVSAAIPYTWYETPNIHHTTIADFRDFVREAGGVVEQEVALLSEVEPARRVGFWPDLLADTAVFVIGRSR